MSDRVVALVHEENGVFGVSFPDFPGAVSGADTLEEAVRKGEAALAFHVAGMIADGIELPRLRSYAELKRDAAFRADAKGALVTFVPLELPARPVRVNVSLDERLLARIDQAAEAAGQSRSSFLAEAAKARMRGR